MSRLKRLNNEAYIRPSIPQNVKIYKEYFTSAEAKESAKLQEKKQRNNISHFKSPVWSELLTCYCRSCYVIVVKEK